MIECRRSQPKRLGTRQVPQLQVRVIKNAKDTFTSGFVREKKNVSLKCLLSLISARKSVHGRPETYMHGGPRQSITLGTS